MLLPPTVPPALPFVCLSVSRESKGKKVFKQLSSFITTEVTQFSPHASVCSQAHLACSEADTLTPRH